MKKIYFLAALLLLMLSVTVKAQSTYLLPWPGATQHYIATVTDIGNDNPVRWWVATNVAGTTKAIHGVSDDYTFVTSGYNSGNDRLESIAAYDVEIKWGASLANGTTFYVFLEVQDDASGCWNRMALPVVITADFNAMAYDVTGSLTPGTVDPTTIPVESCPDEIVNAVWNGTGHTNIGSTEILFRIEREHSLLGWQFEYTLSETTSQAFNVDNIRMVDEGGTVLYNGTLLTGTISVGSTEDYVLVYAQITNQQGKTLSMEMNLITTSSLTKDSDDNLDSNGLDNKADHVIKPIPVITGFGGL